MEDVLLVGTRGAVQAADPEPPGQAECAQSRSRGGADRGAAARCSDDDGVAAVILAGAGRAFCPGMDTSAPRLLTTENRRHLVRHGDDTIALFKLLARIDKPVIAAVHGYALGAGCSLALGSDLVVAAESARFGFPELRAGLTASTVTAHAVHVMGRKIAFELPHAVRERCRRSAPTSWAW